MKLSALLAPLIAAKADHATIMEVVLAYEAEQTDALERRRESDRKRQERRRHVTSRDVTVTDSSRAGVARVEDNLQTKKISGQKENKKETRASDEAAFRADLSADLPSELLDGCIKVRRERRGQVSGLAARLFRDDAAACGMTVLEAARTCVSRSWITVKPEYFKDRQHRGQGPPKKVTLASMWRDEGRKLGILPDDTTSHENRRLEARNGGGLLADPDTARAIAGSRGG